MPLLYTVVFALCITFCASQTVVTECGPVKGQVEPATGVNQFLGIPYAAPPIGNLRWKATQSLRNSCWSGTFPATSFGASCMQKKPIRQSEDCLFINIWTPSLPSSRSVNSALLPTMVFFHGGSYVDGSGNTEGSRFVNKSDNAIVYVTINYRLNAFGFLALKEFASKDGYSGNYGVLDMIESLKFVKRNIAAFGGDPNLVTIFGQSSGGTGVLQLLASPLAKGLFHRAILESASTRIDMSLHDADLQNRPFVQRSGCYNSPDIYQCLYNLSSSAVLDATPWTVWPYYDHPTDLDIPVFSQGPGALLSIADGYVNVGPVDEVLFAGGGNDVPIIVGTNEEEIDYHPQQDLTRYSIPEYQKFILTRFSAWSPIFGQQVLNLYDIADYQNTPQLAYETITSDIHVTCGQTHIARRAAAAFQSPVYRYVLTQRPSNGPVCLSFVSGWCSKYAFHGFEWYLVTDTLEVLSNYTMTAEDKSFADLLRKVWVTFAKHGKIPKGTLPVDWPTMNQGNVADYPSMLLNSSPTVVKNWRKTECNFWHSNGFYPYSWSS